MSTFRIRRGTADDLLADAHHLRRVVFIDEQGVSPDLEMDGLDSESVHFVCYDERTGRPVGTARLRFVSDHAGKAERVAVHPDYRGRGIGRRLMSAVEEAIRERSSSNVVLHAQTAVEEFYRTLGYRTVSDEFEEDGIPHVKMKKELQ